MLILTGGVYNPKKLWELDGRLFKKENKNISSTQINHVLYLQKSSSLVRYY